MLALTADEIRREIAAARARVVQAQAEIELLSRLLDLHSSGERSNIRPMVPAVESGTRSKGAKIAAGRARALTPSRLACIEAELSDGMIAELVSCGRSTVQAWHDGTRPIPRAAAEKLAKHEPRPVPIKVWQRIRG